MEDEVVLVDVRDNQVGTAPKLRAHQQGLLHRAISVFLFDDGGRMLLQRRAEGKYHSPGLWSNTCCSHPYPGEQPHAAAHRRLAEEMGLETDLDYAFSFVYRAELGAGLSEHELDHVFVGQVASDAKPRPDPDEISEWRWSSPADVEAEMTAQPERFTAWFPLAFEQLRKRGLAAEGGAA